MPHNSLHLEFVTWSMPWTAERSVFAFNTSLVYLRYNGRRIQYTKHGELTCPFAAT